MPNTPFQRDVLKLAKAMEQGIQKTKKMVGSYVAVSEKVIYACALGAAWVNGYSLKRAMSGAGKGFTVSHALSRRYPALMDTGIFGRVIDKNDELGWSRERIAAWLIRVAAKFTEPDLTTEYKA